MHRDLKISVVIPCYNEEEGVRHVIERLPAYVDEVVVVDNNSTDRTAEVAASLGARVVHEKRKGYGAAYKAGLPAVTGDVTVTLDGDGTYPSEQIAELVDHLVDEKLDFVSASRFPLQNPEAMNFSNKVGNMVLTVAMAVLYARVVRDSQSGMWVYRSAVYPGLNVTSDGMAFSEEIKIQAIRHRDVKFGEYPINYHPRVGEVKLEKWRDGFRNLMFLVTKRFS
ncbi:MAG: glycosyltransferase family 2 protein [Candidatus Krumholzibacteria bacterium]|nr:glycosyltransferase family 2 protein [Candidatus Krumholzibacteria bacterium]MDH4336396.1 glycosyltransferase family 2 protein [Candidatus Krumholzibacteria bacterium]MDH5269521.1 glycosyltransferase family 2 protein [Candidatus Krumholzibacteria bacterium]MDH5627449.1 glycosyltransferase family 2 protein [Candidatus Krumholzibacteria bacterium]